MILSLCRLDSSEPVHCCRRSDVYPQSGFSSTCQLSLSSVRWGCGRFTVSWIVRTDQNRTLKILCFYSHINNSSGGITILTLIFVWWLNTIDLDHSYPLQSLIYLVYHPQHLEEQRTHAAHLWLLLDEDLEVLIDDGDSQQDTSSRPETHITNQKSSLARDLLEIC